MAKISNIQRKSCKSGVRFKICQWRGHYYMTYFEWCCCKSAIGWIRLVVRDSEIYVYIALFKRVSASSNTINQKLMFITSNKDQPLLLMNGYVYRCNKKRSQKKYCTCTTSGYNVFFHTDMNNDYLRSGRNEHQHQRCANTNTNCTELLLYIPL
jgi:hypothetical protein